MKSIKLLLFLLIGLTGCQPKGKTLYQFPTPELHPIDQVVVVIDYLNLRDDLGAYWDFDSFYHQKILNQMLAQIDAVLAQKGYPAINGYLLSSGLLINQQMAVEHYIEDALQPELLYPPFILAQQLIPDEQVQRHRELLTVMVKYIAQRRHHDSDELTHRGMQMGYQTGDLDLPVNTGILYLHVDLSAPGAIKQLSTLLVSGAIASQSEYASIHIDGTYRQHASAFLIHSGSGQILWKNHSNTWTPNQPIDILMHAFPTQ